MALCLNLGLSLAASPLRANEAAALATGLTHVAAQDWPSALAEADRAGPVAGDVIRWFWLRAGEGRLGDYEAFVTRNPDWPGLRGLREKGEEAVARSTEPARVLAWFGEDAPRTAVGAIALVRALQATGQAERAADTAAQAWSNLRFDADQEDEILALSGQSLKLVHELRLDNLLWDGDRVAEARRMLPRVGADWQALAKARIALREGAGNAPDLLNAVPAVVASEPGLSYDRFAYRMKADRYDDARAYLIEVSTSRDALGRPEAWAERRALLARRMLRQGEPKNAYRVAARHFLDPKDDGFADLEFFAGFVALRKLDDPDLALTHFAALKSAVSTPISISRAEYWTARALDQKGDEAGAIAAYTRAAAHQSAYYGLLAAEQLGMALDPGLVTPAKPTGSLDQVNGSSVLAAAVLLSQAGDRTTAKRFFLHLGEGLDDGERAALSELALKMGEPHIALVLAKQAAERGLILPRAYFPTPDMVPESGLPVSRALVLSIARRESEFDPTARSSVGARGLMQVMPETAKLVAKDLGVAHETGWLTSKPAHNVQIGSAYLAELAERFGPSVALIASGYNAGPRRPDQWIQDFGDPRSASVDVVDWVESIPFEETRTYVMRVAESVVIYRAKAKGTASPIRLRAELTGQ